MSDTANPTPQGPAPGTHCTWCGADYAAPAVPEQPRRAVRIPEQTGPEPTTHCEWCGADYPLPDDKG